MNHVQRPEVLLKVNDKEYKANCSLSVCENIEKELQKGIMSLAKDLMEGNLLLPTAITILRISIRGGGNDIDGKVLRSELNNLGYMGTIKLAGSVLTKCLDTGQTDEEKKTEVPE